MTTRENIIERIKEHKGVNKCAIYLEVEDAKAGKAWANGTGDPNVQVRAIAQYLVSLSGVLQKENGLNVSAYKLAQDIAKMVDNEPRIEGHKIEVKENK